MGSGEDEKLKKNWEKIETNLGKFEKSRLGNTISGTFGYRIEEFGQHK